MRLRVIDNAQGTDIETKTITVTDRAPIASFTAAPNPVTVGQTVSFNGSGSADPDGSIAKYEWDLDGNGSYETDTGTTPTTSKSYAATGDVTVKLRVTDNEGFTGETTRTVTVVAANQAPTAAFTVSPVPADGRARPSPSTARPPPIPAARSPSTSGTSTATAATRPTPAPRARPRRPSPRPGASRSACASPTTTGLTAETTRNAFVNAAPTGDGYSQIVQATSGLAHYWRMGELTGGTLADANGTSPATTAGGVGLGAPGGVSGDANTSVSFDGADDAASAAVNLSATNKVTLEFWLKWDAFADDDDLAFEFTPNFNGDDGGFLVDPNARVELRRRAGLRRCRATTPTSRGRARAPGTTTRSSSTRPRRRPARSRPTWTASPSPT